MNRHLVSATFRLGTLLLGLGAVQAAAALPARAGPFQFTNQHVDVDLRFESGGLSIGWHDETNDIEYEADQAQVLAGANAIRPRPVNPAFDFFGVGAGAPIWVLPQIQNPDLVFLGLGTEEIDNGLFQNNAVTLSLVAVRGPGFFSLYSTDAFGTPTVFMASADGISSADQIVRPTASHQDFNWALTALGEYELDFRLSGTLLDGTTIVSEVTTLSFIATPEPASCVLWAVGAAPLALYLRRRRAK